MPRIRLRHVMIVLNRPKEVEIYDKFKEIASDNASDATKMTKKLWADYVREAK